MDSRIKNLLDKYWECETTLEEENELREYFNSSNASDSFSETKALFQYFNEQRTIAAKDSRLDVHLKVQGDVNKKNDNMRTLVFRVAKIAAGVLVLVAATYLVREEVRKSYPEEIVDTYSDPELAYQETKKALMMISKSFGKAQQEASKIRLFNEAEQIIQGGDAKKENEKSKVEI